MTNTFEATLANIIGQESDFASREEKAVEMAVVLPLLKQVGWNTENVSEIYPQRETSDGGKVDFDLQIEGESRILIEVKRWRHDLNEEDEEQLKKYCQSTKPNRPKLAVLTSGRVWRLYLAPTANRGNNSELKRFDEIDVTVAKLSEAESSFRQFLARDSMVDFGTTVKAAKDLYRKLQDYQEQKRLLTKAWNELANDRDTLTELVLGFAEIKKIPTNPDNVLRFLDSLNNEPMVNKIGKAGKSHKKPASFALPTLSSGNQGSHRKIKRKPKGWKNLLLELCELMQKRHPDSFRKKILSLSGWFSASEGAKYKIPVSDEGIYARWGNAGEFREACYDVVIVFGYRRESLEIKDSNGVPL